MNTKVECWMRGIDHRRSLIGGERPVKIAEKLRRHATGAEFLAQPPRQAQSHIFFQE